MGFPSVLADVAFASDPLAVAPVWTDVSAYLHGFKFKRGRGREIFERVQPGTGTLRLRNIDGRFTPENTASPYYPNVRTRKPMRLRATWDAVTYALFRGYIERWPVDFEGKRGMPAIEVPFYDAFGYFNRVGLRPYRTEVLEDAPLTYWALDEAAGVSTGADLGSLVAPVTFIGGPGRRTGPFPGGRQVVNWDGTDHAENTAPPAALNITGALTVEFWARFDNFDAPGDLALVEDPATGRGPWHLSLGTGGSIIPNWNVNALDAVLFVGGPTLAINTKYHIVLTRDPANRRLTVYVNGTAYDYDGYDGAPSYVPANTDAVLARFIDGALSHVAVYNRVLPPERVAAHYAAAFDVIAGAPSGSMLGSLLDILAWPAADRTIDAGSSTLQDVLPEGNALELLQTIAVDSESGLLFMYPDGKVGFHQRSSVFLSPHNTSAVTFGDGGGAEIPYEAIAPAFDGDDIINEVRVTREGGIEQVVVDQASITANFRSTYERDAKYLASDLEALDLANFVVARRKDQTVRIDEVSLVGEGEDIAWPQVLGRDIHFDRVRTIKRPSSGSTLDKEGLITFIEHDVAPRRWRAKFGLSPATGYQAWVLGDTVSGVLGSTTILGF